MAVTATVPANASVYSTTGADSYATGSWTSAGAERTYIAFATCVNTALRSGTVSGNGLTWAEWDSGATLPVDWDSIASPVRRAQVFWARGTASNGVTTVDYGAGGDNLGGILVVVELDGVDGATNGGVVQGLGALADSGTGEAVALAAFGSATNATLAAFFQDIATAPTPEETFSTLSSGTHTGPNTGAVVQFLASSDTSPSATGGNNAWAGIALEIKESAGGSDATAQPGVIAAVASLPAAGPSAASTVTPSAVATTASLPQASLSAGSTVTPNTVAAIAAVPQASPSAGSTVTPAAVAATTALPQATPNTGDSATAEPGVIAAIAALPAASPSAGSTVTPSTVAASVLTPQASPSASADVSPSAIAAVVAFGLASLSAGATVTPATIAVTVAILQATIPASALGYRRLEASTGASLSRHGASLSSLLREPTQTTSLNREGHTH